MGATNSTNRESTDWRNRILEVGAAALDCDGAVVVRVGADGPEVVSRVYRTQDYLTTKELRRVAVRRSTRLLNQDQEGRNHYVVIRYDSGQVVVWTGMHGILIEKKAD